MKGGGAMRLSYDLHIHSCLSPCGDADMTPNNIVHMALLAGFDMIALTDHNTAGNCAAFCRAAQRNGLLALAGMELCTREEIHMICLFPTVQAAEGFSRQVARRLPPLKNRPELFGHQYYMDEWDLVLGEERAMLLAAADIGVGEAGALAARFGGVAYPAHIDRASFSLLSVLGLWEPSLGFSLAEVSPRCSPEFRQRSDLTGVRLITSSDAHSLDQVWTAEHAMDLPEATTHAVLEYLRGDLPF